MREDSDVNPATGQPYSAQLPDCRAYELVSPPDSQGFQVFGAQEARKAFQVVAAGSIFYTSPATLTEAGAAESGHWTNVYRSTRGSSGWVTRDMTSFAGNAGKYLVQGATNGTAVLIATTLSLSPEDRDNPSESSTAGSDLYVVHEDGSAEFVTHGTLPAPNELSSGIEGTSCCSLAANADLSAIAFKTDVPISELDPGTADNCYIWRNVGDRLAYLTNPPLSGIGPHSNCELYAVTADGRPVFRSNGDHRIYVGSSSTGAGTAIESAVVIAGALAQFDGLSPDGETVYLTTTEQLAASPDTDADVYAVNVANAPPGEPAVLCISCGYSEEGATYIGQSADGSHVFFQNTSGALYSHDAAGNQLVAPGADQLDDIVTSQNGSNLIASTSVALTAPDVNQRPDIYEFSENTNWQPDLVTSGASPTDAYLPDAVSNSGMSAIYEAEMPGTQSVIWERHEGETEQITPIGSTRTFYHVLGIGGSELNDVFFEANTPLVPQDDNAGTTDIYDARRDGGFARPSQSMSEPTTPNPSPPTLTPYSTNLAAPSLTIALLPADSSSPASAAKQKVEKCKRGFTRKRDKCAREKVQRNNKRRHKQPDRRTGR